MKELLTFDDVLIVPKFSEITSRRDVDISVNRLGFPYMRLPILSANMDSITGPEMAVAIQNAGGQAVLHRFCSIEDNVKMFLDSKTGGTGGYNVPMVSIGLGIGELDRAKALLDVGANTVVIDVAHGASMSVVNQVKALRKIVQHKASIIVGNFATGNSVKTFLDLVGSKAIEGIKIGIGPGSVCSTRIKTGVGIPQLSAIMDVVDALRRTGIVTIADGGLRNPGDCAKALGAGADMLMIGGMFAGTMETPGELVYKNVDVSDPGSPSEKWVRVDQYKKYRGSASKESYEAQGKEASHRTAEGESILVPYRGSVLDVLQDIEGGLRSSFSYVGAMSLCDFHNRVEFVRISNAGYVEGTPHGKR